MKPITKYAIILLMALTLIAMFIPVANFKIDASGVANEEISKQQDKVDSAQKQLDRWVAGGKKSESEIQKQRDKVAKEQEKLDALLANQKTETSLEGGESLSYALLPYELPSELEIDQTVINQYKVYNPNFSVYYT